MRFTPRLAVAVALLAAALGAAEPPAARPELAVSIDDKGVALVKNAGKTDVAAPFDVTLTCKVRSGGPCGVPFRNGPSWTTPITLKPGVPSPQWQEPGTQMLVVSWPGSAVFMIPVRKSYPKGDYEITIKADGRFSASAVVHSDFVPTGVAPAAGAGAKTKN